MLVVPLSPLGLDFIVFFRKGTPQEVRWAGSRPDHPTQHGIEIWRQVSAGKSKPWDDEVAETAEVLGVIYSRFINVWREKESAVQANSVTSLLLANASHEGELRDDVFLCAGELNRFPYVRSAHATERCRQLS